MGRDADTAQNELSAIAHESHCPNALVSPASDTEGMVSMLHDHELAG